MGTRRTCQFDLPLAIDLHALNKSISILYALIKSIRTSANQSPCFSNVYKCIDGPPMVAIPLMERSIFPLVMALEFEESTIIEHIQNTLGNALSLAMPESVVTAHNDIKLEDICPSPNQ